MENTSNEQKQNPTEVQVNQTTQVQPGQPVAVQPVQYVMMEKSLKGVGGWLIFFMICFGISAIYGLIAFFAVLAGAADGDTSGPVIVTLIFSPFIAAASVVATVFIAMQKSLGKWLAVGAYGLTALYSTVMIIVSTVAACSAVSYFSSGCTASATIGAIGGILVAWVIAGLYSLYFFLSKRVKQTLVK